MEILSSWYHAWLNKAISDPSWHNDLSIVYATSIAGILSLHILLKWLSNESDSDYIKYLLQEEKRRKRERKKKRSR